MPMAVKFGLKPVMPMKLNKLVQGIIKKDGTWIVPTGPVVQIKPSTWDVKFDGVSKYTLTHDLNTSNITIQITMREKDTHYQVIDINDNGIVIETLEGATPAPCEWKFALRKNH